MTVATWAQILEKIPTNWLDRCYTAAIQSHDTSKGPFGASSLLHAYRSLVLNGTVSAVEMESKAGSLPAGPPCDLCGGTRWKRVSEAGTVVDLNAPEETAHVVRCDHHVKTAKTANAA